MDADEAHAAYAAYMREIGPVFEKGLLRGEDFYEAADLADFSRPSRRVVNLSSVSPSQFPDALASSPEPLVKVLHVERLKSDDPTRKRYDLWCTFHRDESGWGEFDHFTLVLVNPTPGSETSNSRFADGAKVDAFSYEGTEL